MPKVGIEDCGNWILERGSLGEEGFDWRWVADGRGNISKDLEPGFYRVISADDQGVAEDQFVIVVTESGFTRVELSADKDRQSADADRQGVASMGCFGFLPFVAGVGTATQWKLAGLSSISVPAWAGSLLVGAIGTAGIIYLLATLRSWRSWGIVVLGYLLDLALTLVFLWPILTLAIADPLGLWPYVLTTVATSLAGLVVGYLAHEAPLRHALGMVSIDFFVAGISGFFSPQALTWVFISRIAAAYCAGFVGALIGQHARFALKKDRSAIGNLLGQIVVEVAIAAAGGILAVVLLQRYVLTP